MERKPASNVSEEQGEEATVHNPTMPGCASGRCPFLVLTLSSLDLKRSFFSVVSVIFYIAIKLSIAFLFEAHLTLDWCHKKQHETQAHAKPQMQVTLCNKNPPFV